ncbi:MAG: zinc-dependent alcohol dehydrogenase family protein [Gammaproteobacteria bacterium]
MQAQVIKSFGNYTQFAKMDLDKPVIKPGHLIVKVMATSVNPVDCKIRAGKYPTISPEFPSVLHGDMAGIVVEVGDQVNDFAVGDEIYGCAGGVKGLGGALAEFMLVDAKLVAKKPTTLSMTEAAALPLVAITAWEALFDKANIKAGQKVLIHAGTGGVDHIAVQLAKWAGADVYTTISSPEKAEIVHALGIKNTINYRTEEIPANHFDMVFDTVGGENLDKSLLAVAPYGNVVSIQANASHHLGNLYFKTASLHTVFMLLPMLSNNKREHHGEILKQVAALVDKGLIKPILDERIFTLDEVGEAHARLESGKAIGKVVIAIQ